MPDLALYSAVDADLTRYSLDVEAASVAPQETLRLPAKVQYAWRHPALPVLYVACSSGGPRVQSDLNLVVACRIGTDGRLDPFGAVRDLPRRAVHVCVDPAGDFLLAAHNWQGGGLSVFGIAPDGSLGPPVEQPERLDFGIYPHQVRVLPSGRTALVVDRGVDPRSGEGERPGALRTFPMSSGHLAPGQTVAPDGGYGFGPRHVDFHPTEPWLFASDERRNRLLVFGCAGDRLEEAPAHVRSLLADPANTAPRQLGGAIHVHPSGRFVYVANRADHTEDAESGAAFSRGENSIAVFRIDTATGAPTLIQHAPTRSFHVRTFSMDPSGRLLVAASIKPMRVRAAGGVETVPAMLTLFRIGADGRLDLAASHPVATRPGQMQYWSAIVPLR